MSTEMPEVLEKKVGPMPVGLWLIFGAVGVAGGMWLRNRSSAPMPVAGAPVPGGGMYDTVGSPITPATDDDSMPKAWTDALWLTQGVAYLATTGVLPTDGYRALSRFLNSLQLSATDVAYVNRVISFQGLPPESTPTLSVSPTAPGTSSKPAQQTTVRTRQVAGSTSRYETANEVAARINAYGWRLHVGSDRVGKPFTGDAIRYINRIGSSSSTPLGARNLKLGPAK